MKPPSGIERSAINSYSVAGACVGVIVGLVVAEWLVGQAEPEWLFAIAGVIAMPFAVTAYVLVSGTFARAGPRDRRLLAISGWIVLVVAVLVLIAATGWIFPKAAEA